MSAPFPLPGYKETALVDPFEVFVGPVYEQGEPPARRFAILIDARHVNMRGVIHGGMLMTFADAALGQAVWDVTDRAPSVTLNMQSQFLKPARAGDVIVVQPELIRRTRSFVFMRGDFRVGDETVLAVSSVWKLLGQD
ncbi:MAG TPA: PaaI family thioesterase [Rhizomicrobium sp.]|nr:PaaI family thioesterase [Rhizomicrobium sp.]